MAKRFVGYIVTADLLSKIMNLEHIRPREAVGSKQPADILLINIPATFQQGFIPDDEEPPFGLIRIAEVCDGNGFKPILLDAHRAKLTPSGIVKEIILETLKEFYDS